MGKTIHYKRSHFVTQLPEDYLYTPSHGWAVSAGSDLWKVGITKFATRMLGEMVDYGFEREPGTAVEVGEIIGWVEGFKAISDVYCILEGVFEGSNPELQRNIELISRKPYTEGWLYQATGKPDERCMGVQDYIRLLDRTIDRILEQQKDEGMH